MKKMDGNKGVEGDKQIERCKKQKCNESSSGDQMKNKM